MPDNNTVWILINLGALAVWDTNILTYYIKIISCGCLIFTYSSGKANKKIYGKAYWVLSYIQGKLIIMWYQKATVHIVTRFLALTFYCFLFLAETYMMCANIFCQKRTSSIQNANFLIDPHCKTTHFWQCHDVAKSRWFLWWENSMSFVGSN